MNIADPLFLGVFPDCAEILLQCLESPGPRCVYQVFVLVLSSDGCHFSHFTLTLPPPITYVIPILLFRFCCFLELLWDQIFKMCVNPISFDISLETFSAYRPTQEARLLKPHSCNTSPPPPPPPFRNRSPLCLISVFIRSESQWNFGSLPLPRQHSMYTQSRS